ncbi:MAG: hypothetical protein M3Z92_05020, partial [Bacteroidota bacterium]|nr:hypothetical protein [Bacteroidota bacterium]
IFSDGSGNNNYGNNSHCSWLINPIDAFSITLNFTAFNTESVNDVVNVYDGNDNTAPLLGSFSGNSIPTALISSGGAMFIEFITNSTITGSGWNASYTSYQPYSNSGIVEYDYWFDNNYANVVPTSISPQIDFQLNASIPTNNLSQGLHSFHIRFMDNNSQWSSVNSTFFVKLPNSPLANTLTGYEYWFDNNYAGVVSASMASQNIVQINPNIAAATLPVGLHLFHIRFEDNRGQWSSILTDSFDVAQPANPGNPTANSNQCKITLKRMGFPPPGVIWYWQGTVCGTSTTLGFDSTFIATSSGIYFIRAYDSSCRCWSLGCGSVSVIIDPTGITWTGTISSNWTNGNNWSCGTPPNSTSNVTIPPGTPFTPIIPNGITVSIKSLLLMPGAVLSVGTNAHLNILN